MKHIFSAMLLLALAGCGSDDGGNNEPNNNNPDPDPVGEPVITQYAGYTLLWNDEFTGTSLDLTKWNYETGTGVNGDFGTGQLDRATNRVENVKLGTGTVNAPGELSITTRREQYVDRDYTSGRINTQGKFSVGPGSRIEARVWARDVKYKGQGFAFWMMPAEKPADQPHIMWPQGGEIDIMEYVGAIPYNNLGSVHYAWFWENNQYQSWNHGHKGGYYNYEQQQKPQTNPQYGGWPVTGTDPNAGSGGYHLYRIDWYADRIEFSVDEHVYHINYFNDGDAFGNAPDGQDADATVIVDGKRVFKSEYSHHFPEWEPFDHKFYMILSAGVGGNDNMTYGGAIVPEAVFPCTTLIDYVRVYRRD
ncbi:glycoside hydrolase family 16 protein [Flavobacterium sp. MFBS3-15]|uniref:glycoside hydrolase family 16 protein n=1 Tax=Flavobacterium sp. MFBS3-15 TaxID=2989816 RepID=UPI0022363DCD|nr:glycoside hydrolase family 16 protein [Flavobacterium sp. MFBS3-15]MCW4470020.1 glycoside hydrolase family 16 protein [Flavobacterium sp. MFBS3-15]